LGERRKDSGVHLLSSLLWNTGYLDGKGGGEKNRVGGKGRNAFGITRVEGKLSDAGAEKKQASTLYSLQGTGKKVEPIKRGGEGRKGEGVFVS